MVGEEQAKAVEKTCIKPSCFATFLRHFSRGTFSQRSASAMKRHENQGTALSGFTRACRKILLQIGAV